MEDGWLKAKGTTLGADNGIGTNQPGYPDDDDDDDNTQTDILAPDQRLFF